jgi:hypothetical protein
VLCGEVIAVSLKCTKITEMYVRYLILNLLTHGQIIIDTELLLRYAMFYVPYVNNIYSKQMNF